MKNKLKSKEIRGQDRIESATVEYRGSAGFKLVESRLVTRDCCNCDSKEMEIKRLEDITIMYYHIS